MTEMLESIIRPYRTSRSKALRSIQVEASSNCFMKCAMCPRTALKHNWKSMNMPLKSFEKMSHNLADVRLVYLSGWGEPLLNKDLLEMVRLAKEKGASVGFTTNGMLLSPKTIRRLVELELDILSISVAGATAKTHETLRVGSNFQQLLVKARTIRTVKNSLGSEKPKTLLLFLMTQQNLSELPLAVDLARETGAEELVATNLTYLAIPEHIGMKAYSCEGVDESFIIKIKEAEQRAKEANLAFRSYPLEMKEELICEEDPLSSTYVSCDGYVSPCVYLNLPVKTIPRIFEEGRSYIPRTHFGNINETDLLEIWEREDYRSFRQRFERRVSIQEKHFEANIHELERVNRWTRTNPLPGVCETCYKAYGV